MLQCLAATNRSLNCEKEERLKLSVDDAIKLAHVQFGTRGVAKA